MACHDTTSPGTAGPPHGSPRGSWTPPRGTTCILDAPKWDSAWLRLLLAAGGFPEDAVRLRDVHVAYGRACDRIRLRHDAGKLVATMVLDAGYAEEARFRPRYRALDDARAPLWTLAWEDPEAGGPGGVIQVGPGSAAQDA